MKMKLAVAFAVLLFATLARADSTPIIVDVTATSCTQCGVFPGPAISLVATFTVEQETGTFFDPSEDGLFFTGTADEIISMAGTFNGSPITIGTGPDGTASWLVEDPSGGFQIGSVYFSSASGNSSLFVSDWNLLDTTLNGVGYTEAILWSAVDPGPVGASEPSSLLLSGIGLAALIGLKLKA
jgi:hypothetical protein